MIWYDISSTSLVTSAMIIRTFIRHKDRQYKIETGTDRIKKRWKKTYHTT